ncbi:MAG: 3,4-dihydroxy-2-butanone-4-phosphate synthase [Halobacteriales archaeon]|nr:3,4-dihydroxy-2-butanone-4-phosphate synthase [Halobacteriales archaeon]
MALHLRSKIDEALRLLRAGQPVLVFDGADREGETDILFAGHLMEPRHVRTLRREAGGLVFLAVDAPVARQFGLPFVQDLHADLAEQHPVLRALRPGKLPYDARSSFSLTVNHRDTFTGITDRDRALTIRRFAELGAQGGGIAALGREFRAPGHVALCVASEPLLEARRGHTELACALGRMAGVPGVLAGAEMLDGDGALARTGARAWADAHGTLLLTGEEVAAAWATFIARAADGPA